MSEYNLKAIGERLKAVRSSMDFKQVDFAREMQISNANLSEMEQGNAKPRFELLYNLILKFKINVEYIFYGKGEMFLPGSKEGSVIDLSGFEEEASLKELISYCGKSVLVRSYVINSFRKYFLEHEELIQKEIDRADTGGP